MLTGLPCASSAASTILVYGDSLSVGYGMRRDQGWANLLQRRLLDQGYSHVVANASISGETTSGGRTRIEKTLQQHQPDLIILELGANDGLRGLQIKEIRRNLAAIIEACLGQKVEILLVGMRIPPNYGPRYTQEFHATYQLLAQQYKLRFLDFLLAGVAGQRELIQDDGLHPNALAQERILDNIWPALQPMLDKPIRAAIR